MDLEHPVEILGRDLADQAPPAADAGIVDQDVDRAEILLRAGDAGLQRGDVADVESELVRPPAARADLRRCPGDPVDDVVDDHVGAALGQQHGVAAPHAAARAGHHGNSSV